jgi:orotidine-5'-phosphate decarboxylase
VELSFNDRLLAAVKKQRSHLCVGLDPDTERFPTKGNNRQRLLACQTVVEAAGQYAAAFKPNAAFIEDIPSGMRKVSDFIADKHAGALRICDAKRGDIGNTSKLYASTIWDVWNYDAVTVNPLMGYDSVEPFLIRPERGVFLLCLTSNPGADDFLLKYDLFKRIAEKAVEWNRNGNVSLVVGATQASHAGEIRKIAPELPFLIPGIGAQGGSLVEILDAIDAKRNPRFLVNASRAIMFPGEKSSPGSAAKNLRDEINIWIKPSR